MSRITGCETAIPGKSKVLKIPCAYIFLATPNTTATRAGKQRARWANTQDVLAVPYDVPMPGYRNDTVNTLRLWKSEATDEFNLDDFNAGSYTEAVAAKNLAEQITMVLYPNDASENGKELRLRQQYFLASASLQDVLAPVGKIHTGRTSASLPKKLVFN